MGNEAAGSAVVLVGGNRYERFSSLTLKRSIEEGTCSGSIVLSWPGADQFNAAGLVMSDFVDGASCQIVLDGQLAATATLDTRTSKGSPKSYELTLQFRGQMSHHVDSSPNHDTGQENKKTPAQIMKTLMKGGPGQLIDKSNFSQITERFIVAEGESTERACRRVAREFGLTFWENPEGNWVLQGQDTSSAVQGELRLGKNFTNWSTKRDIGPRFGTCAVAGSGIPTDQKYGKVNECLFNESFRQITSMKQLRALIDGDQTNKSLGVRGTYESSRRAAQGLNVTLRLSTWSDSGGNLWGVSEKYHVVIPVDDIDDDLLVSEVEFELTADSRTATLIMVSSNIFGGAGAEGVLADKETEAPIVPKVTPYTPPPPPETPPAPGG